MHIFNYYFQFIIILPWETEKSMFCAAFLSKKTSFLILTSKLAPSLVYHGLIRALLSLGLKKNDHHYHPLKLVTFDSRRYFKACWNSSSKFWADAWPRKKILINSLIYTFFPETETKVNLALLNNFVQTFIKIYCVEFWLISSSTNLLKCVAILKLIT